MLVVYARWLKGWFNTASKYITNNLLKPIPSLGSRSAYSTPYILVIESSTDIAEFVRLCSPSNR